jgi:hypothetical protein
VYSLMGLFDVHSPMLYGKGPYKAFERLQQAIISRHEDHSLFLPRYLPNSQHEYLGVFSVQIEQFCNNQPCLTAKHGSRPYIYHKVDYRELSLSSSDPRSTQPPVGSVYQQSSLGLRIEVPLVAVLSEKKKDSYTTRKARNYLAMLNVSHGNEKTFIYTERSAGLQSDSFLRLRLRPLFKIHNYDYELEPLRPIFICNPQSGNIEPASSVIYGILVLQSSLELYQAITPITVTKPENDVMTFFSFSQTNLHLVLSLRNPMVSSQGIGSKLLLAIHISHEGIGQLDWITDSKSDNGPRPSWATVFYHSKDFSDRAILETVTKEIPITIAAAIKPAPTRMVEPIRTTKAHTHVLDISSSCNSANQTKCGGHEFWRDIEVQHYRSHGRVPSLSWGEKPGMIERVVSKT